MAKKARLCFTESELEYQRRYGTMPDYHHERLVKQGLPPDIAGELISARMGEIFWYMKYLHDHPEIVERLEHARRYAKENNIAPTFRPITPELAQDCPF